MKFEVKKQSEDSSMVSEFRNHHVKKLLNHLGGKDVPPYLQKAIKRSYSEFAEDIEKQLTKDTTYEQENENSGNR